MSLIATLKKNNPEEVEHNFYWTNLVQPQKAQQVKLNSNLRSQQNPKFLIFNVFWAFSMTMKFKEESKSQKECTLSI